jgi:hypothetical protein
VKGNLSVCHPFDTQKNNLVDFLVSLPGLVGFQLEYLSTSNFFVCEKKGCFGKHLIPPTSWNLSLTFNLSMALVSLVGFYPMEKFSIIEFNPYSQFLKMENGNEPQKARELEDDELMEENFTFTHRLSLKVDSHSSTLSFSLETMAQHRALIVQLQDEVDFLHRQGEPLQIQLEERASSSESYVQNHEK